MDHPLSHWHKPQDDEQLLSQRVGFGIEAHGVDNQVEPFFAGEHGPLVQEILDVDAAVLEGGEVREQKRRNLAFPDLGFVVSQFDYSRMPPMESGYLLIRFSLMWMFRSFSAAIAAQYLSSLVSRRTSARAMRSNWRFCLSW